MIKVDDVTMSYMTLRGRKTVFRNLSFEIPDGVNVGLIGRNGAGKSTLVRLLSAVEHPDSGKITTTGRFSWPVGLAGGMQRSLSGRENVKFVCRVHGIRTNEMAEKIQYVRDFAELGDYFDQPVVTYSSGMRARLAFGMSMAIDFDYYLIDEILAVGDRVFRKKSRAVFKERRETAKVLLVSHSMKMIRKICDMVIYLDEGKATIFEDVKEGIRHYRHMKTEVRGPCSTT